jgi:hypothetical protein
MKTSMRLFAILGLLVPAMAQAASMSFDEYSDRRRGVIEDQVMLSDAVASDFWMLYDEYTADTATLMTQRSALSSRVAPSEDDVDALIDLQEDLFELREKFVKKLKRADVPAGAIYQFLLIEQRLDAIFTINQS